MTTSIMKRTLQVAALAPLTLAMAQAPAHAENPLLEGAPTVIRVRPLHEGRHMILPQFAVSLGDPYVQNLMAGLGWRYHFTPWFGIGVDVLAGTGVDTGLKDDISSEYAALDRPLAFSTTSLRLLANASIELVPFSGKAVLFSDALIRMDVHINAGVGVAMVAGDDRIEDTTGISPHFGVGIRIFPSQWLSIGLDLKDHLVNRAVSSRRDGSVPESSWGHNWLFGLSVGFSFPFAPDLVSYE